PSSYTYRPVDQQHVVPRTVIGAFSAALLALMLLGRFFPTVRAREEACVGEPIAVRAPYQGGILPAHSCSPQCADGRPRYLAYTNGRATQCEPPPGCGDKGEDEAITCRP